MNPSSSARALVVVVAIAAASGQLNKPRVEDGGWQPVRPGAAKKGRAADARQDNIPAFYVWLPSELLDHIHPNGPNFAQIQAPPGFQRGRSNYLPAIEHDALDALRDQTPRSAAYGSLQSEEELKVTSNDAFGQTPSAAGCRPVSSAAGLGNRSLRMVADHLGAGRFLDRLGVTEAELLDLSGHNGAYTLFLVADEAVELVSPQLLDAWRSDRVLRQAAMLNHVLPSRLALADLARGQGSFAPKAAASRLNVRRHASGVVTVNGQRVVTADAGAARGGVVHVLSGPLSPAADRDVLATLSDCGKYDGFLTLATGTGVADLLRQGRRTLFLPSNDALSKVPPEELRVYQKNITALKEFLTYHIVDGVYYSQDLLDGQYLKSMHNGLPIRVSVNVDGCSRRLYEANNSPLYRADIPASNGVIHVVDWILLPGDHKWCTGVTMP